MRFSWFLLFPLFASSFFTLEAKTYVDLLKAYSIEFPTGWVVEDEKSKTHEWVSAQSPEENSEDPYLESIQITYNAKKSETDLNEYLPEVVKLMKEKYHAAAIEEIGSTKIGGEEAKWILFTATGPGKQGEQLPLKALHYILIHEQRLMIILCVSSEKAFERWRPFFEKTIDSLKFL